MHHYGRHLASLPLRQAIHAKAPRSQTVACSRRFFSHSNSHSNPNQFQHSPILYIESFMQTMGKIGIGLALVENAYDFYDHFYNTKTPVHLSNGVKGMAEVSLKNEKKTEASHF